MNFSAAYCPHCKNVNKFDCGSDEQAICLNCEGHIKYPAAASRSAYLLLEDISKPTRIPWWGYITLSIAGIGLLLQWTVPIVVTYFELQVSREIASKQVEVVTKVIDHAKKQLK